MNKAEIKELIKKFDLPKNTKFIGYVVHIIESEEYLHSIKYESGIELRKWSKTPETAKTYKDKVKAEKEVVAYNKNAVMAHLLDTGNQLIVLHEDQG